MSIKTPPIRRIFNTFNANSVVITDGVVQIQGLPAFASADIVSGSCYRACPTACTPQAVRVTPTPPSATCECPWVWEMWIETLPCLDTYRVQETFPRFLQVSYVDPNQAIPTVNAIVTSAVLQINSDPNSTVTATAVGTPGSYSAFDLVEKDCDGEFRTCGFNVLTTAATFSNQVVHVGAVLSASEVARMWPVLPGSMLSRPETAFCGTYCVYRFKVDPKTQIPDPHLANAYANRFMEVELYANRVAATFITDWDAELTAEIACFGEPLV